MFGGFNNRLSIAGTLRWVLVACSSRSTVWLLSIGLECARELGALVFVSDKQNLPRCKRCQFRQWHCERQRPKLIPDISSKYSIVRNIGTLPDRSTLVRTATKAHTLYLNGIYMLMLWLEGLLYCNCLYAANYWDFKRSSAMEILQCWHALHALRTFSHP